MTSFPVNPGKSKNFQLLYQLYVATTVRDGDMNELFRQETFIHPPYPTTALENHEIRSDFSPERIFSCYGGIWWVAESFLPEEFIHVSISDRGCNVELAEELKLIFHLSFGLVLFCFCLRFMEHTIKLDGLFCNISIRLTCFFTYQLSIVGCL